MHYLWKVNFQKVPGHLIEKIEYLYIICKYIVFQKVLKQILKCTLLTQNWSTRNHFPIKRTLFLTSYISILYSGIVVVPHHDAKFPKICYVHLLIHGFYCFRPKTGVKEPFLELLCIYGSMPPCALATT